MQEQELTVFVAGDVMTGRGIDQILSHPSSPELYEPYLKDAKDYVRLAEKSSGRIPAPVSDSYIWGMALGELERVKPDLRIINLETTITQANAPSPRGINYRMHPRNIGCLKAAGIQGCALANNHMLDWGVQGLEETLHTLQVSGLRFAGAGRTQDEAEAPAVFSLPDKGRVLLFSVGLLDSGVPHEWSAQKKAPGLFFLPDLREESVQRLVEIIRKHRSANDLVILSIHWGGNWGERVSQEERAFAHAMIDRAGVDLIHGHSAHHPRGIEIYGKRPILYGCGDLLNDYEGIGGHEEYRSELGLLYFLTFRAADRSLAKLELVPTLLRRLQLCRPAEADAVWRLSRIRNQSRILGTDLEESGAHIFRFRAA